MAPYTLPKPTQKPPRDRVEAAHKALHALGRACKVPAAEQGQDAVRRPLNELETFAQDFPAGGFRIDDEPGTTLALMIVVWDQAQEPVLPNMCRRSRH
ncbi:hypothetical protein G5V59_19420 [Nocardioides sp. W3-2-3]|nr:hypothetical protein [Nocardioides convexus]